MLVRAQAASNCMLGWSSRFKLSTKIGRIPDWIKSSIGGFRSDDNNFRAAEKYLILKQCVSYELLKFCEQICYFGKNIKNYLQVRGYLLVLFKIFYNLGNSYSRGNKTHTVWH